MKFMAIQRQASYLLFLISLIQKFHIVTSPNLQCLTPDKQNLLFLECIVGIKAIVFLLHILG